MVDPTTTASPVPAAVDVDVAGVDVAVVDAVAVVDVVAASSVVEIASTGPLGTRSSLTRAVPLRNLTASRALAPSASGARTGRWHGRGAIGACACGPAVAATTGERPARAEIAASSAASAVVRSGPPPAKARRGAATGAVAAPAASTAKAAAAAAAAAAESSAPSAHAAAAAAAASTSHAFIGNEDEEREQGACARDVEPGALAHDYCPLKVASWIFWASAPGVNVKWLSLNVGLIVHFSVLVKVGRAVSVRSTIESLRGRGWSPSWIQISQSTSGSRNA